MSRRFLGADGTFLDYIAMGKLITAENIAAITVGEDVVSKFSILLGKNADHSSGLQSIANSLNFPVGSHVALFKLTTRPELNGRTGTVIETFNKLTGRVGVRLDVNEASSEIAGPPIALKLSNIMLLTPPRSAF